MPSLDILKIGNKSWDKKFQSDDVNTEISEQLHPGNDMKFMLPAVANVRSPN